MKCKTERTHSHRLTGGKDHTAVETSRTGEFPKLPWDLRETIGERQLVLWALEAQHELDASGRLEKTGSSSAFDPRWLTLLTCAYATGLYASAEVAEACETDGMLRYICAGAFPDWRLLRQFRRRHVSILQRCLAAVLGRAWEHVYGPVDESGLAPEQLLASFEAAARERLELARMMDHTMSEL